MALNTIQRLISEAQNFDCTRNGTERRHELVRQLSTFYAEPSARQIAIRMAADLRCYQHGRWQFDRCDLTRQYSPGSKPAIMRDLLLATGGKGLSGARIREILAGRKCV